MPEPITAEVLEQDRPENKVDAAELTTAKPEGGEVDPQATEKPHDDETKRKGGWLRKLNKAEQERDFWREEALRNRKPEVQQTQTKEDVAPVKPKAADFTGTDAWEKYEEAKDKWVEELADFKARKAVEGYKAESQKENQQQTIQSGWAAQCAEAEKDLPDFREVAFSEDTPMSQPMMDAIVTSEFGAKIAYELGQNPDEAERISKLNPIAAIREIGKIESRIASKTPTAVEEKDKLEELEAPAVTTRAPKPPTPVRKATGTNTEPSDADDYKTWLRKREAQLRSK